MWASGSVATRYYLRPNCLRVCCAGIARHCHIDVDHGGGGVYARHGPKAPNSKGVDRRKEIKSHFAPTILHFAVGLIGLNEFGEGGESVCPTPSLPPSASQGPTDEDRTRKARALRGLPHELCNLYNTPPFCTASSPPPAPPPCPSPPTWRGKGVSSEGSTASADKKMERIMASSNFLHLNKLL